MNLNQRDLDKIICSSLWHERKRYETYNRTTYASSCSILPICMIWQFAHIKPCSQAYLEVIPLNCHDVFFTYHPWDSAPGQTCWLWCPSVFSQSLRVLLIALTSSALSGICCEYCLHTKIGLDLNVSIIQRIQWFAEADLLSNNCFQKMILIQYRKLMQSRLPCNGEIIIIQMVCTFYSFFFKVGNTLSFVPGALTKPIISCLLRKD